jgi:hypothetical protein
MYKDIDYVYDALGRFEQVTGMKLEVESRFTTFKYLYGLCQ